MITTDLAKLVTDDLNTTDDGSLRRKMAERGITAACGSTDEELFFEAIDNVRGAYLYLYVCARRGMDVNRIVEAALAN